jgi:hypothetical protein
MNFVAGIVLVLVLAAILALIVSLPVMLLWDWVMPAIFGLPEITWLQALGLSLLCGLLFKSKEPNTK